jgi:large subunit ribosomal protein L23
MTEAKRTKTILGFQTLLKPVVTEKSSLVGGSGSCAVFYVDPRATKTDIKNAVEGSFDVGVKSVRTVNMIGKRKRTMRAVGSTNRKKKAYVTLKPGETLDIVEGV